MLINISGQHLEVTTALRNYVLEKFNKLEKHFDHITHVNVVLSVEKKIHHIAKAEMHTPKLVIAAKAEKSDMYDAIEDLVHKLDVQVLKHKDEMQNLKRSESH